MYKFNKRDGNGWDTIVTDFIKLSKMGHGTEFEIQTINIRKSFSTLYYLELKAKKYIAIFCTIYFIEREKVGSVLFLEKIGVRQNTKINWEQLPDLVDMAVNSSVSC